MLTAVTGINWGDEGKGRVIDLLAEQADITPQHLYRIENERRSYSRYRPGQIRIESSSIRHITPRCSMRSWRWYGSGPGTSFK